MLMSLNYEDFTFELELNLSAQTIANWITHPPVAPQTFTLIVLKTNKTNISDF